MEDNLISAKLKSGDNLAVDEFYNKYANIAYRTAFLITSNAHTAEDAVQESFIEAIRSIHKLKNDSLLKSWFFKIVTHKAIRLMQKDKKQLVTDEIGNSINPVIKDEYFANERYQELYDEINKLSIKLKVVIVLHYFNDMSIEEMGKVLSCSCGTIKSRLFIARKKLRKSLDKEEM